MELKLKEKYVLLSLDDSKGGLEKGLLHYGMGLAACIMLDLTIAGIIELKNGKVYLKSSNHPKDKIYWDAIQRIKKSGKDKALKHWISYFNMVSSKYRKLIIKDLVSGGILRKVPRRFLGIPYYRYPALNPNPENEFRKRLLSSLNNLSELDSADIALLAILEASKSMIVLIKDKAERKRVSAELKTAVSKDDFGKALNSAFQEMTAAIVSTVVITGAVH